jgi:hypothetical protein
MTRLEKVLYTGKAHIAGGLDGASRTDDRPPVVFLSQIKLPSGALR